MPTGIRCLQQQQQQYQHQQQRWHHSSMRACVRSPLCYDCLRDDRSQAAYRNAEFFIYYTLVSCQFLVPVINIVSLSLSPVPFSLQGKWMSDEQNRIITVVDCTRRRLVAPKPGDDSRRRFEGPAADNASRRAHHLSHRFEGTAGG